MTTLGAPAVAPGVLTQGGSAWTAPSLGANKYFSLVRPEWHPTIYTLPLINRALEKCWQWWRQPLTLVPDGDMQALTAGQWTTALCNVTKSTTRTFGAGIRSLHTQNTGLGGAAFSALFEVEPQRSFRATVRFFAVSGTARLVVYDGAGVQVATVSASPAVTNSWQELSITGWYPNTAVGGTSSISLGGLEATADIYWADMQLVPEMMTRFALPSWITQWRTEEGEEALRIYRSRNRLGTIGSWPARAYDLMLIDPGDYQIIQTPTSLNPLEIEFARETFYTGFPLFVEARRPFIDFGALAAEADVTAAPLRLVVAAAKNIAALERRELNDRLPMWEHDFVREQKRVASLLQQPPPDNRRGLAWQVWSA